MHLPHPVADPGFLRGGCQPIIWPIFSNNCIKMMKFRARGARPLRSATGVLCHILSSLCPYYEPSRISFTFFRAPLCPPPPRLCVTIYHVSILPHPKSAPLLPIIRICLPCSHAHLLVARRATYVVDGRFFSHFFWKVEGTVRTHVNSRVAHVWLTYTVINV